MKYVQEFIARYRDGSMILNKDRVDLIHWLENVVLPTEGFHFDEEQIENCIKFIERWYFKLDLFQKFLIAFVFYVDADNRLVFDEHFWTMARGNGKNGLISGLSHYFISHLHGIQEYNVAITANSEDQAKTSHTEVFNVIKRNPILVEDGYFKNGMEKIKGLDTDSEFIFRANNASTQDSFRDGAVFFDEIHQYETWDVVEVQTTGLGKKPWPRAFYIGTNGFVRESVYDELMERSRQILSSDVLTGGLFPFICTLDDPTEVDDETMWPKSNPMFHEPMSEYAKGLKATVRGQYKKLKDGFGNKAKWMVKRMNIQGAKTSENVATREEILDAAREYGDLTGLPCIGSVDFSSVKDFTAVGLLFKNGEEYSWVTHSFVLQEFLNNEAIAAPIADWEREGLLTILKGSSITERDVLNWFVEMRELYYFDTIVIDSYRETVLRPVLEEYGFKVETIRRSGGVQASIGTVLEILFAKRQLVFGNPTMMKWYTNNVVVKRDKDGNPQYKKKEEIKRKTDGFMAMIHALYVMTRDVSEYTPVEPFYYADIYS